MEDKNDNDTSAVVRPLAASTGTKSLVDSRPIDPDEGPELTAYRELLARTRPDD